MLIIKIMAKDEPKVSNHVLASDVANLLKNVTI